jgi:hypothetical protein
MPAWYAHLARLLAGNRALLILLMLLVLIGLPLFPISDEAQKSGIWTGALMALWGVVLAAIWFQPTRRVAFSPWLMALCLDLWFLGAAKTVFSSL